METGLALEERVDKVSGQGAIKISWRPLLMEKLGGALSFHLKISMSDLKLNTAADGASLKSISG